MNSEKRNNTLVKEVTKLGFHCITAGHGDKLVILLHGIGEHLERHNWINQLDMSKITVFQYNSRGHYKSPGKLGRCSDFSMHYKDLKKIIKISQNLDFNSTSLIGHSMGALIVAGIVNNLTNTNKNQFDEIILLSPPAKLPGILPKIILKLPLLIQNNFEKIPGIKIKGLIDLNSLSSINSIKNEYLKDTKNILKIEVRYLAALVRDSKKQFNTKLLSLNNLHVFVGEKDKIIDSKKVIKYFEPIKNRLNIYKNARHELFNEKKEIKNDLLTKINKIL